ncbi:MAG: hypothetical protein M3164_08425 [Actinomycetota bacterium]|nr:hypothetical protein [Actinomycetota bacterium]
MSSLASKLTARPSRNEAAAAPPSLRFDWAATLLGLWLVGGLYLDGWAHTHGRVDQSVFTPWHGVLYSGFLALAALYVLTLARNHSADMNWRRALPPGYDLSLLGVGIFVAGGVGDTIWHLILGIEMSVDALYSPTHLGLALGGVLMITGPIRSAFLRQDLPDRWSSRVPVVLSLTLVLSVFTFFSQIVHPLVNPEADGAAPGDARLTFLNQALGVAGIMLQSIILVGIILLAARRIRLPFGSFILILGANAAGLSVLSRTTPTSVILAAVVAGLVADLLLRWLDVHPGSDARSLRVFAFAVPSVYYLLYFLALLITTGVWWSVHLWMGSVILAGIVAWLLAYLVTAPTADPS